jgi:hypothetical protein
VSERVVQVARDLEAFAHDGRITGFLGKYAEAQVAEGEQFVQLYKSLGGGWQNYQAIPAIRRPQPAIIAAFRRVLTSSNP